MEVSKRDAVAKCLGYGKIRIHVDARIMGVIVPEPYAHTPGLVLNLSWDFPKANMVLGEKAIEATLSFKSVPFRTTIPWEAVWACAVCHGHPELDQVWIIETHCKPCQGRGVTDETEVCQECHGAGFRDYPRPIISTPEVEEPPHKATPPQLRVVVANPPEGAPEPVSGPPTGHSRAPWLRLVK